jgi:hypothetical protein
MERLGGSPGQGTVSRFLCNLTLGKGALYLVCNWTGYTTVCEALSMCSGLLFIDTAFCFLKGGVASPTLFRKVQRRITLSPLRETDRSAV